MGISITPDQAPTAAFTVRPGLSGSATSFDASASSAHFGAIAGYAWSFGDGTAATTSTATLIHTYAAPGSYPVILTVTDTAGTSTTQVFTGQTVSRNGRLSATTTSTVRISGASSVGTYEVAADGGVFAFNAGFLGSQAGTHLNAPVVGMASTPDGAGYWLVSADGGVFAHGDAGFFGSQAGTHLNAPVVGMASTPDGAGYWLVSADGGLFAHGDAGFFGSQADQHLVVRVVAIASTPDGKGYWLVATDGGVFAHGDAGFFGSQATTRLKAPIAGIGGHPGRSGLLARFRRRRGVCPRRCRVLRLAGRHSPQCPGGGDGADS